MSIDNKAMNNKQKVVNGNSGRCSADAITDKSLETTSSLSLKYETPVLRCYGDVRDVTLGPTVGIGESGNELGRRNPP